MIQIVLVLILAAIIFILFKKFNLVFGEEEGLEVKTPVATKMQAYTKVREERIKRKLELDKALEKVKSLKRQGQREKAEKVLLKLLTLFDKKPEVFYELGLLYLEDKKYKNAISTLNVAVSRDSENGFYHHALGLAYLKSQEYRQAAEHFDQALHFNNTIAYRWADLALSLIGLERFKEAKEAIAKALEIEPHNIRYRAILESVEKKIVKPQEE